MKRWTMATAILAAATAGWALAQPGAPPGAAPAGRAPAGAMVRPLTDAEFTILAGSSGLLEVQSSQLAQQRATSDDVKKFAKQMVDDHTKLNQQMAQLLAQKNMGVPQQLAPNHAVIYECLN